MAIYRTKRLTKSGTKPTKCQQQFTGKSAFMMSLAQNIARQGVNVFYFSLEMGSDEFIARAISSLSFVASTKDKSKNKVTAADVLYWSYDNQLNTFKKLSYGDFSEFQERALYLHSGLSLYRRKDIGAGNR